MFTSLYTTDKNVTAPEMASVRALDLANGVTVMTAKNGNGVRTILGVSDQVARLAGLRAGTRVSVLRGTGRDAGKVRIVANPNGAIKLYRMPAGSKYRFLVRTSRLLETQQDQAAARVTSVGKGGLTVAL